MSLGILELALLLLAAAVVVVRSVDDSDIDQLRQAGAAEVVAQILDGSLMLGTQALLLAGR